MMIHRPAAILCLVALCTSLSYASTEDKLTLTAPASSADASSSSAAALPDTPSFEGRSADAGTKPVNAVSVRPFSAVAIAVKLGVAGVGFDVATPLARKLNLRAGASFFSYSPNITEDGIGVNGTITFKTAGASLDYYPFGNAFRISPGLTVYNGNHLTANANIPGGQTFTLNDVSYTSSATNPVGGTFDMAFGNKVAPTFTVGFGNMLPRKPGQHWSVPFEIGFEYIGTPLITMNLTGSACQNGTCQSIQNTPSIQANVVAEQANLNSDISPLKVYPIMSIGLSYKFGKTHEK